MPHAPTTRRCPGTRGATRPVLLLALLVGLLLPAAGATALSSGPLVVDRGATLALPMPDFFGSLQDTDVQVDGILRLPFGLRVFPMSGGSAEGADAFIPYVGSFEHEGTTIGFTRGDDRIEFRDPVVDTDTLGFFADVAIFQDGSFLEIRDERRVFDLSPLFPTLPSLPFPLPGGVAGLPGLPESLPAVVDLFGHDLLVDLLEARASFETESLFSEFLFGGGPLDVAGRSAAFLGVVAKVSSVPEPAVAVLAVAGLAGAAGAGARRRRASTRV